MTLQQRRIEQAVRARWPGATEIKIILDAGQPTSGFVTLADGSTQGWHYEDLLLGELIELEREFEQIGRQIDVLLARQDALVQRMERR